MRDFILSSGFSDPHLQTKFSHTYQLFIQLSPFGLQYCILDSATHQIIALHDYRRKESSPNLQHYCDDLEVFINHNYLLKRPFQATRVAIESSYATLIPGALYEPEKNEEYLRFNHDLPDDHTVRHDWIRPLNIHNIYAVPGCLQKLLSVHFHDAGFFHFSSPLIEGLLFHNKQRPGKDHLFVNAREKQVDIIHFEGNKLLFFNSFDVVSKEDFVYYILFVMEQLGLTTDEAPVILCGDIANDSDTFRILFKYIRNVTFLEEGGDIQNQSGLSYHIYFNLLNLRLCES